MENVSTISQNEVVVATRRNKDRFLEATGKSEQEYYAWATLVGQRMHINKLDGLLCAKIGIYTVAHLIHKQTQLPQGIEQSEVQAYLIENSNNPYELAQIWLSLKSDVENWVSKESILNEWLTGIRKEDFEAHGDPNHAADVSRAWWKKDADGLDGILQEINSMEFLNTEISLSDAIEFIRANRPGRWICPALTAQKLVESRFKTLTTFNIKDYYVEHLLKMCRIETELIADEDLPF
ncbi:hypothetical protein [Arundinibacter roseus]|uniref:Uncharacterized protein n=1 Tax=Arundinibacter roseus TaxID=2070510 RepID=A0A4R4K9E7_9BACT|nr:hypothetical protein [Arundinibacter roseus]TDB64404.1 hypothetical protein EZE20_12025 [Arundinibacter roseus]